MSVHSSPTAHAGWLFSQYFPYDFGAVDGMKGPKTLGSLKAQHTPWKINMEPENYLGNLL